MRNVLLFGVTLLSVLFLFCVERTNGHGMVLDPVGRASRWRYQDSAPVDYDDSQAFCGGFDTQWNVYGGKCGFCGDSYGLATPRPHEHGGYYGQGVISGTYTSGSQVRIGVMLTANHQGYFRFNLCKMDGRSRESDDCFNQYPLKLSDGSSQKTITGYEVGWFNATVVLPSGLTCNHCVLQWTYTVGNSWGVCANGQGAMGCGAQETFRSCSDIRISSSRSLVEEMLSAAIANAELPEEVADETSGGNAVDFVDSNCD